MGEQKGRIAVWIFTPEPKGIHSDIAWKRAFRSIRRSVRHGFSR